MRRGVSWYKTARKWVAQISIDGKPTFLGYFENEGKLRKAVDPVLASVLRVQGKSVAKKLPNNSSIEFLKFHRFCVELSVVFLI